MKLKPGLIPEGEIEVEMDGDDTNKLGCDTVTVVEGAYSEVVEEEFAKNDPPMGGVYKGK